jgi:hypothetical protein
MEENSGPREMRRPDLAQGQSACPGGPGGRPFENVTVATFVLSKKASKVLRRYSSRDGGLRPSPLESDFTSPSIARKENQTMEFRITSPQGKQLSVLSEKLLKKSPLFESARCFSKSIPCLFERCSIEPRHNLLNRRRGWTLSD